jgi:hypothetical protein
MINTINTLINMARLINDLTVNGNLPELNRLFDEDENHFFDNAIYLVDFACSRGHLNIVKWYYRQTQIHGREFNYNNALIYDRPEIIKWFHKKFIQGMLPFQFKIRFIKNYSIDTIKWIHQLSIDPYYPFDFIDNSFDIVHYFCTTGNLDMIEWLWEKSLDPTNKILFPINVKYIEESIIQLNLSLLQWFWDKCMENSIKLEPKLFINSALRVGKVEIIEWFYHKYCYGEIAEFIYDEDALNDTIWNNNFEIVKWIYNKVDDPFNPIPFIESKDVLKSAINSGNLEMVKLVYERVHSSIGDVEMTIVNIWNLDILEWLYNLFKITGIKIEWRIFDRTNLFYHPIEILEWYWKKSNNGEYLIEFHYPDQLIDWCIYCYRIDIIEWIWKKACNYELKFKYDKPIDKIIEWILSLGFRNHLHYQTLEWFWEKSNHYSGLFKFSYDYQSFEIISSATHLKLLQWFLDKSHNLDNPIEFNLANISHYIINSGIPELIYWYNENC